MGNAIRHISPAKRQVPGKTGELSVIIPCAGTAKRMRGEPKALIECNGCSIIERQITSIWSIYPKADIIVVGGYHIHKLRKHLAKHPVRLVYNPSYVETNVLYSISLGLLASITNNVLLVYGDLIFDSNALPEALTLNKSAILVDKFGNFDEDEVGVIEADRQITSLSFGLTTKWAQIAYLTGKELEVFKDICYDETTSRWFGYEGLNEVINRHGSFDAVYSTSKIVEVDEIHDLEKVN